MGDNFKSEIQRINGYLKEVITFLDATGKPIHQVINPVMVELKPRDVLQLFVGSFLIAAPLSFTEEIWTLSKDLPDRNALALVSISLVVVISFIFFNFYRYRMKGHVIEFIKRVVATYLIATSSIILILALINKFPLFEEPYVALKRIVIIGFPTVFGAIISDYLK